MAHRLLTPPTRRLEGPVRLPILQRPGENIASNLRNSMMIRDALRRSRTSSTLIATGPLPGVQTFTVANAGGANSHENMISGLRIRNAPRLATKTRGQSAGI